MKFKILIVIILLLPIVFANQVAVNIHSISGLVYVKRNNVNLIAKEGMDVYCTDEIIGTNNSYVKFKIKVNGEIVEMHGDETYDFRCGKPSNAANNGNNKNIFKKLFAYKTQPNAKITSINGRAFVLRDKQIIPAKKGMKLLKNDQFTTEEESYATVSSNGKNIRLTPKSQIKIKPIKHPGLISKTWQGLKSKIKNKIKGENFEIKTPVDGGRRG